MRTTYAVQRFVFDNWFLTTAQVPRRIVIHRQGNLGVKALNALTWGNREKAFTIHSYVGDDTCYDAIPAGRHAFHVKEARKVKELGGRVTGSYGTRGDYDSIGIETEDVAGGAPGQAYSLTQETRITLLLRVRDYLLEFPHLTPNDVYEHGQLDPWTRPNDLGDALNVLDFREDLKDLLAGRTPWRTVGTFARGTRATGGAPATPPAPPSPVVLSDDDVIAVIKDRSAKGVVVSYEGTEPATKGFVDRVYTLRFRTKL